MFLIGVVSWFLAVKVVLSSSNSSLQRVEGRLGVPVRAVVSSSTSSLGLASQSDSADDTDMCNDGGYTKGSWTHNVERGKNFSYDGIGRIPGCCGKYHKEKGLGARDAANWQWRPKACRPYVPFNERDFCLSLKGRSILFVGDSINEYWHFALLNSLGDYYDWSAVEGFSGTKKGCKKHKICKKYYKNPPLIQHVTNQFLEFKTTRRVNRSWWKYLHGFELLVINSGAWMMNPHLAKNNVFVPVTDEQYEGHMKKATEYLKGNYNGTIIFRTTHPGHPECWKHEAPIATPIPTPYTGNFSKFRWESIFDRNRIAVPLFEGIGAKILDIEPMTTLRPDGHMARFHPNNWKFEGAGKVVQVQENLFADCLHYCTPGPMDTWTELLMNMLLGNIS